MTETNRKIRIALPSKGLLADGSMKLLDDVGLAVYKPNPRQYIAWIPQLPQVEVIFQRPADIVISVRDGSVDFGITGRDIFLEKKGTNGHILALHNQLGFGKCTLNMIVPDDWTEVNSPDDLVQLQKSLGRPLKVATKFPQLTEQYASEKGLVIQVIQAEGTLEIAPTVGYADLIVDLVSTGTTLRDNRLKKLPGGKLLDAEACLIANLNRLKNNPETRTIAIQLLEMVGAHLRGRQNLAIFANVRANSIEEISEKIFKKEVIKGLEGPTISKILIREGMDQLYAIHVVVRKDKLHKAIGEIRDIGGSGVVVTPVNYLFEEEPQELTRMLAALED